MLNQRITEKTSMADMLRKANSKWAESFTDDELNVAAIKLVDEIRDISIIYRAAIKQISTKLEILNEEFQTKHEHNPIHTIKSRIKNPKSVVEKLGRRGWDLTLKSAKYNLNDIAGVRVICPYIEDMYTVKTLIEAQDDIEVIEIRDYIQNPKPNGYRSLHLIVKVPVYFSNYKEYIKVEIQIRTIAMDFWASLEHKLRYKADIFEKISPNVIKELKQCADTIAGTDQKMQDIHNQIIG